MAKPREGLGDARRTWIFHVDDVVIDDFAPKIGVYGLAIYVLLARHAKANKSFPSYRLITQKLGIGRATVVRSLAKLEEVGLITKEVRHTDVGDLDSNLYTLLDLSHLRVEGGSSVERLPSSPERPPSSPETLPSSEERPGVVLQRDQGSIATELEGISFKGSQEKDLNPPPISPSTPDVSHLVNFEAGFSAAPSTRCPSDFVPNPDIRTWAEKQYPSVNYDEAFEAMKDYEFARPRSDWNAALKTWIRRAAEAMANGNQRRSQKNNDPDTLAAAMQKRLEEQSHATQ